LKRFILSAPPDSGGMVRLEGGDYHYLIRVRRLAPGEFFPALLPSGEETLIQVRSVEKGILIGEIDSQRGAKLREEVSPGKALPPIILFQALPKGDKMDLIVRQAAEGGITEIVPFVSEFSVPKINNEKVSRWERIIKEARQQSGSDIATAIRPPFAMDELFACWEDIRRRALGLLFHHLPLVQASLHGYLDNEPETVVLAIGPEGGFSRSEAGRFLDAGFKPVTIGNTVLRTETAALYAAAAIRIILLERNSWEMKQARLLNG
jgi:16S rRNA (uracil1498-N3)-methyltransferase